MSNGKGSKQRPTNLPRFRKNWEKIFKNRLTRDKRCNKVTAS